MKQSEILFIYILWSNQQNRVGHDNIRMARRVNRKRTSTEVEVLHDECICKNRT